MMIGEVIRKYRKEKQMTQEELAEYLGITSSAVNKWENGYSLPDITLLSPIARILGISTDTLLSYKEGLTDPEIEQMIGTLREKVREMDYESVFEWGMGILREYPNCDKLAVNMISLLDGFRLMLGIPEPERYDERIFKSYQRLLKSQNADYVCAAAKQMFYGYMNKKEYDEAESVLRYFSESDKDGRQMRALLYRRQGKVNEAYRIYEEQILEGYGMINGAFNGIFALAAEEEDSKRCRLIVEKQEQLAHLLEMGRYHEIYMKIAPTLEKKDTKEALRILSEIVRGVRDMQEYQKSRLYEHINFHKQDIRDTAFLMKQMFFNDEISGFLKDEPEFNEMMDELERFAEGEQI